MDIVLTTERLILRQFTTADAQLLLDLNSDPEVVKYLHEPTLETEEQAGKILSDIILPQYQRNLGRWAVHLKDNNTFIGWCGLKYREDPGETDLGYRFKKKYWGNGYASEAAAHSLNHGFTALKLPQIIGRAHIDNAASLRILEKIGMQFLREEIVDSCPVKTYLAQNPFF